VANVYRQEIWFVNLNPPGLGREIHGKRPALVVSDDYFNESAADLIMVLPITSIPRNIPSHIKIDPPEGGAKKTSFIKCDQIRTLSKARFIERLGTISDQTMAKVEDALRILLSL
jgi:mRNA interferase MazF